MKVSSLPAVCLSCLMSLLLTASALAGWTEPIHLSELNNEQDQTVASQPCISSDGLSIFFVRNEPSLVSPGSSSYFIIEATRSSVEEPFTNQRVLTELGNNGSYMASPWISRDSLRLYYAQAIYYQGRWQRVIKMAVRDSIGQRWVVNQTFYEIHGTYIDTDVSLNEDETLIMWTDVNLSGEYSIFTATRSEIGQKFSDSIAISELNDLNAQGPYLSSDGLMVYFHVPNPEGFYELWSAVRPSLDEAFTDFLPFDEINQPDIHFLTPCISPDGNALYFFKGCPAMELMDKGIYVSYWVETPYEAALRNLDEAVQAKQQARELIDLAAEKEQAAVELLRSLRSDDLPDGVNVRQVHHARIWVLQALMRQYIVQKNIIAALNYLDRAVCILDPFMVDEPAADQQHFTDKDKKQSCENVKNKEKNGR